MKNIKLLFVLPIFAALAFSGCGEYKDPQVKFQNMVIKSVSMEAVDFDLNFEVENPNPLSFSNNVIDYEFFLKDQRLLTGQRAVPDLSAYEKKNLQVPLTVKYSEVFGGLNNLIGALTSGQKTLPYVFKGFIKTKMAFVDLKLPVEQKGEIPMPELPTQQIQNQLQQQLLKSIKR